MMKNTVTMIFTFFLLVCTMRIEGQNVFPFVENLCYTETYSEKLKVSRDINLTTLTISDKLRFVEKSFVKNHHEYFREGKLPVHEVTWRQWEKLFPKWYKVADRIRIDETGIRSFFTTKNEYLPGGWSGHSFATEEHGFYGSGDIPGEENFYHQNHSEQSLSAYTTYRQSVEVFGLLERHRYFYPTEQMLQVLSKNGFTVTKHTNFIYVQNPVVRITWRLNEKTIVREMYSNGNLVKSVLTTYTYVPHVGDFLKQKETVISPGVLDNGDCIEVLAETEFSDYATDCMQETEMRITQNAIQTEGIRILPNPATDFISIIAPDATKMATVTIISSSGEVMYRSAVNGSVYLDTSDYPPGVYVVTSVFGNTCFTSKFIKQ